MNNRELDLTYLFEDMQRNPEQYKEYVDDPEIGVEPDYPSHDGYMIVDNRAIPDMGGDKPCFHDLDQAVSWAEEHLQHNDYNIHQLKVVL